MFVDCDSCPGQHLAPPACPTCVVRVLLDQPPPSAAPEGPGTRVSEADGPGLVPAATSAVPVLGVITLAPDTDDTGAPLDTAERRAVAVLADRGMLPGTVRPPAGRGLGPLRRASPRTA